MVQDLSASSTWAVAPSTDCPKCGAARGSPISQVVLSQMSLPDVCRNDGSVGHPWLGAPSGNDPRICVGDRLVTDLECFLDPPAVGRQVDDDIARVMTAPTC
jgi:hypothetical protein